MFSDAGYNDFMKRFSAEDFSVDTRPEVKSVNKLSSGGIQANPVKPTVSTADMSSDIKGKIMANSNEGGGLEDMDLSNVDIAGTIQAGVGLVDTISGGSLDDSGQGDGPGRAGKHIFKGAGEGAAVGAAIGSVVPVVGNVIGGAAGAVIGGVGGAFAHSKKTKDFFENKKDYKLKTYGIAQKEREQEYRMAEGLESMENLKALRKKQLGLI